MSWGATFTWAEVTRPGACSFDQVFFTGPTSLARKLVAPSLVGSVELTERAYPSSAAYLGVACLVLALKRPLTPYYVLNVGDDAVDLTGVIEMTNLVDRDAETSGLSLVYVPKYMDSGDPRLQDDDRTLGDALWGRGLARIFPDLSRGDVVYQGVHRTKFVQPLPLVRDKPPESRESLYLMRPFQVVNTSMLRCATLNNDEVVGFVDQFVRHVGFASALPGKDPMPGDRAERAVDGSDRPAEGPRAHGRDGKRGGAPAGETPFP